MFTTKQYRAKAVEYGELVKTSTGPNQGEICADPDVVAMLKTYIIRAVIDADDAQAAGMYVRDWFNCGINDKSDRYPSADAALMAARAAYKGPNADGIECRVWAQQPPRGGRL